MKKIFLLYVGLVFFVIKSQAQTVIDIDGNVYNTITIGNQIWMKENLNTTKYTNGDVIGTTISPFADISEENSPKYQWAYDGNEELCKTYGRLYTWYTVMDSRKVCPIGWHVPTLNEWDILINFLGGDSIAGGKMKETGTMHWQNPNAAANNLSGFNALPGGMKTGDSSGIFYYLGTNSFMWSSDTILFYPYQAIYYSMAYDHGWIGYAGSGMFLGISVRCINDSNALDILNINYNNYNIYPCPAKDILYISENETRNKDIEIYNTTGNLLLKTKLINRTLDIHSLSSGIYFIKVITDNGNVMKKFIKE